MSLPKKINKGFTLIELMVVVSVVAILALIGFALFDGIQKAARDSKRRTDVDTIAKVLEMNKGEAGYTKPVGTQFASADGIPYDPLATSVGDTNNTGCGSTGTTGRCFYCIRAASVGNFSYCDTSADYPFSPSNLNVIFPDGGTGGVINGWIVCANLETGNPAYYCKKSAQ